MANGTAKSPMSAQQNGSIAPSAASHSTTTTTTTTKSTRSSRRRPHKLSYSGWVADKGAKLLIWYSLITVLFRCPSSQDDLYESSPKVCRDICRPEITLHPTPSLTTTNILHPTSSRLSHTLTASMPRSTLRVTPCTSNTLLPGSPRHKSLAISNGTRLSSLSLTSPGTMHRSSTRQRWVHMSTRHTILSTLTTSP